MWFGDTPPPAAAVPVTTFNSAPAAAPAPAASMGGNIPPGVTNGFNAPAYAQPAPQQTAYPNQQTSQPMNQPGSAYAQPMTSAPQPTMGGGMAAAGASAPVAATPQVNEQGMAWIGSENKWYHVSSNQYFDPATNVWTPAAVPPAGFSPAATPAPAAVPAATGYGGTSNDWSAQQTGSAPIQPAYNQPAVATGAPVDYNAGAASGYPQTAYNQYGQQPGQYAGQYNTNYPQPAATTGPPVGYDQNNQGYAGYAGGAAPGAFTPQVPPQTGYATGQPGQYGAGGVWDPNTNQYVQSGAAGGYPAHTGQPTYGSAAPYDPNAGAAPNNAWANAQPQLSTPQTIAPPVQPVQSVQPMTGGTNNYGGGAPHTGGSGGGAPASSGPAAPGMCKSCKTKPVWKESNGRAHDYCGKTCARNDGQKV